MEWTRRLHRSRNLPARPCRDLAPKHVNAAALAADPSDETLREFVRCAAMRVESLGYFAGPILSRDARWRSGSIYVFVISTISADLECSGSARGFAESEGVHERFDGRDAVGIGAAFGEAFWYYDFANSAAGHVELKTSIVKRAVVRGVRCSLGRATMPPDRNFDSPSLASPVSNICSILTQVHTPLVGNARGALRSGEPTEPTRPCQP